MHVNGAICLEKNGGSTWQISHQGCIMRKAIHKEVTAEGRFDFLLDSVLKDHLPNLLLFDPNLRHKQ